MRALGEHVGAALRSLAGHRLRTLLTSLGIAIGVFAVVVVASVLTSMEGRMLKELGADKGQILRLQSSAEGGRRRSAPFLEEDIRDLRQVVAGIELISRTALLGYRPVRFQGATRTASIQAVDEQSFRLGNLELAWGHPFTPTDLTFGQPLAILGSRVAAELGVGPESRGQILHLGAERAEVAGVLASTGGPLAHFLDQAVLVPYGSFRTLGAAGYARPRWTLQMVPGLGAIEARDRVQEALRGIRGLKATDPASFTVQANLEAVEQVTRTRRLLMASMGGMVAISLLVGGIGVMNIMLVTVTERTREIGLRRSLGARRSDIRAQFLAEAALLCAIGGVLGLVVGALVGEGVARIWIRHVAWLPPWTVVSALLVPGLVGLVFGFFPARRAARLEPVEALRAE